MSASPLPAMLSAAQHATFAIERELSAPPPRVYAAWADTAAKGRWFRPPDDWERGAYRLDFRVGGRELSVGGPVGGPVHRYDAVYMDIVPDRRIIYAYDIQLDDRRMSVSLATVELFPSGTGTRLVFTEQGAFFMEGDSAAIREGGMRALFDNLESALKA